MAIVDSLNQEVSTSFVAFVEACNCVASRDDFLLFVYPKLREIVPHEIFAFDIGAEERDHATFRVSPGAVDEKLCQITAVDNCMVKFLIQEWKLSMQPLFYDTEVIQRDGAKRSRVRELFNKAVNNIAGHGVLDHNGEVPSFFVFGGIDEWTIREDFMIRLLVPHLHFSMLRIFKLNHNHERALLSSREKEVLSWISTGKSNTEIAGLVGISPWTVKIHVRNLMAKLEASSRSQAVAKAYQLRIIGMH
jgi:transcriptional regulator EpsA